MTVIDGYPLEGEATTETPWYTMTSHMGTNGVMSGRDNDLEVYADSTGMQVKVKTGQAFIYGGLAVNSSLLTLAIAAADGSNPRIDLVILKRSLTAGTYSIEVTTGVAAAVPVAPTPTQTLAVWEEVLAEVYVHTSVVTIAAEDIIDRRVMRTIGGEIPNGYNWIDNGDFMLSRRTTSYAAIPHTTFMADRFQYNEVGAAVHTYTQDTDVPTWAQSGHKSVYSLKLDCTTVDSSLAAGDYVNVRTTVAGYDYAQMKDEAVTLSFWVKATKIGVYCVGFTNGGGDRSYVAEYRVNTTTTWEKKVITLTLDQTGGTEVYNSGACGLEIRWCLAAGTTWHASKQQTWETGDFFATSRQVNAADHTDNNFWLAQCKLEIGNSETPFIAKPREEEVTNCLRYCQVYSTTDGALASGWARTTTTARLFVPFVALFVSSPTLTVSAAAHFDIFQQASVITCSALSAAALCSSGCFLAAEVAAGLTVGDGLGLLAGDASARLIFEAEI